MVKSNIIKSPTSLEKFSTLPHSLPEALGQSEEFLVFQEHLSRVARVNRPILIMGERGTGKELAVTRLHYLSSRWQAPFIALNCAALSPTLIETELFGHEAGAFTGATRQRAGRFEAAHAGTLFLDEIGQLPREAQEKILRVVEYGTFERVGSSQPIQVDVRIIGATNADLVQLSQRDSFKRDLLDRLSFEVLTLPALRERSGDILLLANHFAARMALELGRSAVPELSDDAIAALEGYAWPGNVRELKNVVERAVYRSNSTIIRSADIIFNPFPRWMQSESPPVDQPLPLLSEPTSSHSPQPSERPLRQQVQEFEHSLVQRALEVSHFNQRKAAQLLGLTYHQFRGLYRKYQRATR